MSLVLNTTQREAVENLLDAILGGIESERHYGDMTDNAASSALCIWSEGQHNYLNIVGDVTVAMLLALQARHFVTESLRIHAEGMVKSWCHETTDTLLDFEFSELGSIELA